MNSFQARYERFGWDFAFFNPLDESDYVWIKDFALKTKGPILELACGTGRILAKLAADGFVVHGLDISPKMLAIANQNALSLPSEVHQNVHLHQGDIREFDFGVKFGLIYINDHSFSELESEEDQKQCLRCVKQNLEVGGMFLLEFRNYDLQTLSRQTMESSWSETYLSETGLSVQRKTRVHYNKIDNTIEGQMIYKITEAETTSIESFPFKTLPMTCDDYLRLIISAGLIVDMVYNDNIMIRLAATKVR